LRIRAAEAGDAAAAAALWTDAYSGSGKGEGRVEPYAESDFHAVVVAGATMVAVDDGGALLGIVALRPVGSPQLRIARDGEAELSNLAVSLWARGDGVGRALVERCLALAGLTGAERIALWSRPYQVEGHRLYESLGFRRTPVRDDNDELGRRLVFTATVAKSR
jgi:ribosomal protein S18 acetylase RimI-like enzyme